MFALGCEHDELPAVQWEGEHILFAPEHPEQVCAGTREYLDRRAGQMLERLGSEPIDIEYYLLDDVSDYCADKAYGCGRPGMVWAETVPILHEIVHARAGGPMPPVLEEGLATYFGDPLPIQGTLAPRERLVELLTTSPTPLANGAEYARAAHFVAFLAETYGWDSLLELDDSLGRDSSAAQIDAAFEAVFGLDVAGILEAYLDYPECVGFVDNSIACAAPPVSTDPFVASFERVIGCEADGVGAHHGMAFVEGLIELEASIDGSRICRPPATVRPRVASPSSGAAGLAQKMESCGPTEVGLTSFPKRICRPGGISFDSTYP